MLGFGGIATPPAYAQLSHEGRRKWWKVLCEYNLLIQREYPNGQRLNEAMDNFDRLADATPHYYGNNFPNGEISDFDYIRTLRRLDGIVFFEFWQLPPWARRRSVEGQLINAPHIEAYTRAMVGYCRACKEKTGAPPEVVGIQNEILQPTHVWHEMTLALRKALDEAGFDQVKIHMHDSGSLAGGIRAAKAFRESPEVWKTIDYSASHMYDFQRVFTDPDQFDEKLAQWKRAAGDKPFLSTELCINSPAYQMDSYRLALTMGQLYHKNLTIANASAICYCWSLLNVVEPSYGMTRSLVVVDRSRNFVPVASSYQLRVFGSFSRRIHRGMVRVKAESDSPNLLVSAFVGPDNQCTLVLLNRSTAMANVSIDGVEAKFKYREDVAPYFENLAGSAGPDPNHVNIGPGMIMTLSTAELKKLAPDFKIDGP
jgi:hypothetical protein